MLPCRRAAYLAAPFACLLGAATLSVPSSASDVPDVPILSATAMLASVTAPLFAGDAKIWAKTWAKTWPTPGPDFSSAHRATTPAATPAHPTATASAAAFPPAAKSLPDLVADHATGATPDDEAACLATTVYYESHGEPLTGQLAVAQTILNRMHSGRFADSVCGVVKQRGQFSFLHGGRLPTPPQASGAWQTAVAVALIARDGLWKQIAPEALYFHARGVSPGWGRTRVASLGQHIFFR